LGGKTVWHPAKLAEEARADRPELARRCREKLASFKAPREFRLVERLPRNALGKVQKRLL
jgi:acyl-coenzyme A synthetase/AMP-(fatty) acid ligase